jgi:hypothetical protein
MSIASFSALRTQIASWLNRTDLTDAQLSQFVAATEADMRNDIEVRESEQRLSATMSGDGFTAPTDYLTARILVVDGLPVQYLPPETYAAKVDAQTPSGYFTINGNEFSVLGGDGKAYELLYLAQITALSADGDSNWVLANASNVYLWGGCKYGCLFLRDPEGAGGYAALYDRAISQLNKREREAKYAGPIVVRCA